MRFKRILDLLIFLFLFALGFTGLYCFLLIPNLPYWYIFLEILPITLWLIWLWLKTEGQTAREFLDSLLPEKEE